MSFSVDDKQVIVSYHYIREPQMGLYPCSPSEFERQIKFLSTNYRLVDIGEVFTAARDGSGEKLCAVTFDDGTKDHYENARPILLKYGTTATFFPIAGVLDGYLPFVHRVHVLLGKFEIADLINDFNTLLAEKFPGLVGQFTISTEQKRAQSKRNDYGGDFRVDNFKETIATLPAEAREDFLERCFAKIDLSPENLAQEMFMEEEELLGLVRGGFFLGNHTYNHVPVDVLKTDDIKRELEMANDRLARVIGKRPFVFSYPWGRTSMVAGQVLANTNFDYAVTVKRRAVVVSDDRFLLPRYDSNDIRDYLNS